MVDPRIASGRDRLWKANVIRSEIRSRAELNRALPLLLHPSSQRIPRTDPLVQIDYVRVVDLDIGASKSDICAIGVVTISERAGRSLAAKRGLVMDWYSDSAKGTMMKNARERMATTKIVLNPRVECAGDRPNRATKEQLRHQAHDLCCIANCVIFPR
jgi:hypothetical protein